MEIGLTTVAGVALASYVVGVLNRPKPAKQPEPDEVVVTTVKTYRR